jgi:nucleotide-binding universal stress UspA family protein
MIQQLLVPLDGSGFGEETLPYAAAIARHTDAFVDVAHVHVPHPPDHLLSNTQYQFEGVDLEEYDVRDRSEEEAYLEAAAERIRGACSSEVRSVLLTGMVADAIDGYVRGTGPGIIVMSTHGRTGLSRAWLGSVADALVRHAPWPVLLVRPREAEVESTGTVQDEFGSILVPLDGSCHAERILDPVADLARPMGSSVRLLQVVRPNAVLGTRVMPVSVAAVTEAKRRSREYLGEVARRFEEQGVRVDVEVIDDSQPALTILEVIERESIDLVALATHGHQGVRRAVLGSVADKVLRGVEVPLLLLGPGVEPTHGPVTSG